MALVLQLLIICLLAGLAGQQAQAERPLQQHLGAPVDSIPEGITQPELQELVSIVFQEGHQVDFGLLCAALNIQHMFDDCHFRQVSVRLPSEKDEVLSFNVPDKGSRGVALVIVCHTAHDVNEIFVVSMSASLRKAFVADLDGRFAETDVRTVENTFKVDMAYWARNLGRVYDDLGLQKPPHRR
ncbi:hypothetical protein [Pseudorhodoplanes sp.]|jgi:hypothetical protein|uniref:hypothetical protein n=1 Tax=Pseudorhodoplanes sp. TaxID=1934341 RepID=UPI003D104065